MKTEPAVRQFRTEEWPLYRDLRLSALADSPDAFGSLLKYEQPRSDDHWADGLAAGVTSPLDLPLLVEVNGVPGGLAWGKVEPADPSVGNVYQMWVAPAQRGVGAGHALLTAIIQWASDVGVRDLRLGVTRGDSAALRLYQRLGFVPVGDPEPLRPGSSLHSQPMHLAIEQ